MNRYAAIFITAAVIILGWLFWQQALPQRFIVSGFIEADQIRVGSQVGGRVAEIRVEEGDRVSRGDVLYTLEPFDLEAQLAQAHSDLAANEAEHERLSSGYRKEQIEQAQARWEHARAELEKAVAGPRKQDIAVAEEQVKIAHANLELAEAEFKRLGSLVKKDQVSIEDYDASVRSRKAAQSELVAAEQTLSLLHEGTRTEDIAAARALMTETEQALKLLRSGYRQEDIAKSAANVAAARARVAAITARIEELEVRAPCDCVVEAIELRPGDLVSPNAPSVALLDLQRLWVRTYVPEVRLSQVKLGQPVAIRVDGLEDQLFTARITFIAQQGEFTPRNIQTPEERSKQVFRTKVTLQDGHDRLRVGMAADVIFEGVVTP